MMINFCIDCSDDSIKEICDRSERCMSCYHRSQEMIPRSKKTKNKIRKKLIGKSRPKEVVMKISKGKEGHLVSDGTREKLRKAKLGIPNTKECKEKQRVGLKEAWKNPSEKLLKTLENGFGKKCISDDGLYFLSLGERGCYYWARIVPGVVEVKKFGRIDFILTLDSGDKVALEYHPNHSIDKKSSKQYYNDRRRLLNKMGHKDLKLVVMTSLSNKEKRRVENILSKLS